MRSLRGDLKSAKLMYLKAVLFLIAGTTAAAGILVESPSLRTAFLLGLAIWSFCRLYYFAFYVVEKYIDPGYRFAGLVSYATKNPVEQLQPELHPPPLMLAHPRGQRPGHWVRTVGKLLGFQIAQTDAPVTHPEDGAARELQPERRLLDASYAWTVIEHRGRERRAQRHRGCLRGRAA